MTKKKIIPCARHREDPLGVSISGTVCSGRIEGTCPFSEEISNEIVECDCCDELRHECVMDI